MATPRNHIEEIRKVKFSIGGDVNPLTEDLHQAVRNLSAELYAKDAHFLMELIQNAEDNEYPEGVNPTLEFIVTDKDITQTGADSTLLVFNNEKGFSSKNIDSICSVGRSTKKGKRKEGYIGEKGIGFKSVFLITSKPYIFSNGYKIRFSEQPTQDCTLGYIVPEWVEDCPTLSQVHEIYGSNSSLPTTVFVLPLKHDKVKAVKEQLSSMHPEVLLFLSNIRKLSVREENKNPKLNSVTAISIASETNFVSRKNIDAQSCTVHLSAEQTSESQECTYYMWKQKFPVKAENKVDVRLEVEEWVITIAFPFDQRLDRGMGTPGVYAFLPTEMVTNLPFIIQADFLLASSRETILLDNKWNKGILNCVPTAFVNALSALVKRSEDAPRSSLTNLFKFLPVEVSPYKELEMVRDSIQQKMMNESIIPCESYTQQNIFGKPSDVAQLLPAFWSILHDARDQGVNLSNFSSHGKYIIHHSFARKEYDDVLNFLGVKFVGSDWYAKCIQSSNLVTKVSEDVYLDLLKFISSNWTFSFKDSSLCYIPLLKYMDSGDRLSMLSISESNRGGLHPQLLMSEDPNQTSWLIDCNKDFNFVGNCFFMPLSLQKELHSLYKGKDSLLGWLQSSAHVCIVNCFDYASFVKSSMNNDRKLVVAFAHFLWHSYSKSHLSFEETAKLSADQPLLDRYGKIVSNYKGVLIPAKGSKWVELMGMNPWLETEYVQLGEEYLQPYSISDCHTTGNQLLVFLERFLKARDIPNVTPPNYDIRTVAGSLTKQNAMLLLDWIQKLMLQNIALPDKFLNSIKNGSWLRVTINGNSGYKPPSHSFLLDSSSGNILQQGSVFVDIPLVDQVFYDSKLKNYKEVLRKIGVMFDCDEACAYIGKHLMSIAASSSITLSNFYAILNFIRYLRENSLSPNSFIKSLNVAGGRWIHTELGIQSPYESVLYDNEWKVAKEISDLAFVDVNYYGAEISKYQPELELLSVVTCLKENYKLIGDCIKEPSSLTRLTDEAITLILECLRNREKKDLHLVLKDAKFLRTSLGFKAPCECFLYDPAWGDFLKVFGNVPLIGASDKIMKYKSELSSLGVVVSLDAAAKAFANVFNQQVKKSSIDAKQIELLLASYRKLQNSKFKFPADLKKCFVEEKWLRTRLGDYRAPKDCILFGPSWESIQRITRLPFLDEKYCGQIIHNFSEELEQLGVVVEFCDGAHLVSACLRLPSDPSIITSESMLSLLECVKVLRKKVGSLSTDFLSKVSGQWIRTHAGFQSPDQCLLFNSDKLGEFLKCTDGPFLDEMFYGPKIKFYDNELKAMGVIVYMDQKGLNLIANHVKKMMDFSTIVRVYTFLNENSWKSENSSAERIWIPDEDGKGTWVTPNKCVCHDKSGLFDSQLFVLEKYYDSALLPFFFSAFEVKMYPSVDDCFLLWHSWETTVESLSHNECVAFWKSVLKHGTTNARKAFSEKASKLPALSPCGSEILLCNKEDVYLPDDLYLKKLLEEASPLPIFLWCPRSHSESRTTMLEFYDKIKVKLLSKHVVAEETLAMDKTVLKSVSPPDYFIGKELAMLILSFLAQSSSNMAAKARHEAVTRLSSLKVLESAEPITTTYTLELPASKQTLTAKASRMIRWDKDSSTLFVQKMDTKNDPKFTLQYATYFADVISEGVLWKNEELITELTDLLKIGFFLKFDKQAVEFLMVNKNLQTFPEDDDFLSSTFPSC